MRSAMAWLLLPCIPQPFRGCFPWRVPKEDGTKIHSTDLESWEDEVKSVILEGKVGLDPLFCQTLLCDEDEQDEVSKTYYTANLPTMVDPGPFIVQGLPCRPFYRELAACLFLFSKAASKIVNSKGELTNEHGKIADKFRPLVAGSALGMTEMPTSLPPPPKAPKEISQWLKEAGKYGILELLGMRRTVGTHEKCTFPPSHKALLSAAAKPQSPKSELSVAARALAKHAHRGSEQFFGVVSGGDKEKNAAAIAVVRRMLEEAVWINVHSFGGTQGAPVLEVRVAAGYGARWKLDWQPADRMEPHDGSIIFRGFLEPNRADGHQNRWRH